MSTLVGCRVGLGAPPATRAWSVGAVVAPVVEPDLDRAVREGVIAALVERGALDPAAAAVRVEVLEAEFRPGRRGEGGLLYEARLVLRVGDGSAERVVRVATQVVDPGTSEGVPELRARTFSALAREAARDGIGWLVDR